MSNENQLWSNNEPTWKVYGRYANGELETLDEADTKEDAVSIAHELTGEYDGYEKIVIGQ